MLPKTLPSHWNLTPALENPMEYRHGSRSGVGNAEGTKGLVHNTRGSSEDSRSKAKSLLRVPQHPFEGSHPLSSTFPYFHWRAGISHVSRNYPSAHCHTSFNSPRKGPLGTLVCSSSLSFGSCPAFMEQLRFFQNTLIIFIKQPQHSQFAPTATVPL